MSADNHAEVSLVRLLERIEGGELRKELKDTPKRVLRAYEEIFSGYKQDPKRILHSNFYEEGYDEVVLLKDIAFSSICEHHLLPFEGMAHVAYLPNKHVVGVSKLARLVEVFARRLQMQERLTVQIAESLNENVRPYGVGVVLVASHSCMACRGVNKPTAKMVTSKLIGQFQNLSTRAEFMHLIK